MKVRFQVISDIHLESYKYNNTFLKHPIKANNLILAGDIGNPLKENYKDYLHYCSYNYDNTFLITGNHEYWYNTIDKTNDMINKICNKYKNIHFLNNQVIELIENNNKYKILGGTLWTYIQDLNLSSLDNRLIKEFNFDKRNRLYIDTKKNLINNYYDLIITHHGPSYKLIHPIFHSYKYSQLYVNNLDNYLYNTKYWICGHLHYYNTNNKDNIIINPCHNDYKDEIIELD
jgi:predicted phosphohydrolase